MTIRGTVIVVFFVFLALLVPGLSAPALPWAGEPPSHPPVINLDDGTLTVDEGDSLSAFGSYYDRDLEDVSIVATSGQLTAVAPVRAPGRLFDADVDLGTGWSSQEVAVGDLDGDGDVDLFITVSNETRIWLNDGQANFTPAHHPEAVGVWDSLQLGDLDGDGDLDALTGSSISDGSRVWLNNGDASYTVRLPGPDDRFGQIRTLYDVDGDDDLDAYYATQFRRDWVWYNNGLGVFTAATPLDIHQVEDAFFGDLDADLDIDVFTATASTDPERVWLWDPANGFKSTLQELGRDNTGSVWPVDIDRDGDLDAITSGGGGRIWTNDGDGFFSLAATIVPAGDAAPIAFGDLDADGDGDLLFRRYGDFGGNEVWLQTRPGRFLPTGQPRDAPASRAALGDLDGDGDLDAVILRRDDHRILLNGQTRGSWIWSLTANDGPDDSRTVTITVIDESGLESMLELDVVVANVAPRLTSGADRFVSPGEVTTFELAQFSDPGDDGPWRLVANWGDGSPNETVMIDVPPDDPLRLDHTYQTVGLYIVSFNVAEEGGAGEASDGAIRVTVAEPLSPELMPVPAPDPVEEGDVAQVVGTARAEDLYRVTLEASRGDASLLFDAASLVDTGQRIALSVLQLGDLDADGDVDWLTPRGEMWENRDAAFFPRRFTPVDGASEVSLGDLDADGDLDAFFQRSMRDSVVMFNDGTGIFRAGRQGLRNPRERGDIDLGDLDGDGDLDAFVARVRPDYTTHGVTETGNGFDPCVVHLDYDAINTVWINDGGGSFSAHQCFSGGSHEDVRLGDIDGDGDLDAIAIGTSRLSVFTNDGHGTFQLDQSLPAFGQFVGVADMDNDSDLDVVTAGSSGTDLWTNDGSGTLVGRELISGGVANVALGDVDRDGDLDIYSPNWAGDRIWLNRGDGVFPSSVAIESGSGLAYLADVDGNGGLDAIVASFPLRVWLNRPDELTWIWTYVVEDGPSDSGPVELTLTAPLGGVSTTLDLTAVNVAPQVDLTNSGPVPCGSSATVRFANLRDPSAIDRRRGLTLFVDLDDDGTFEIERPPRRETGRFTIEYEVPAKLMGACPGTHTVNGRIADKDGGFTDVSTTIELVEASARRPLSASRARRLARGGFRPGL